MRKERWIRHKFYKKKIVTHLNTALSGVVDGDDDDDVHSIGLTIILANGDTSLSGL